MYSDLAVLLFTALLAGSAVLLIPTFESSRFKSVLGFSGAYLFSITVIHLLPELFHESENLTLTGIYVLAGFFLQMVLEYFSSGVEHGHIHLHTEHAHVPYSIMVSLCVHAFLEGTLLVHPTHSHGHSGANTLLYGLVLHKIPESFALMSVLVASLRQKYRALLLLLIFALASPLGLYSSHLMYTTPYIDKSVFNILFALVAGNFLYISTTIFFEASTNHKFKAKKLMVSLIGATMAILAEFFLK